MQMKSKLTIFITILILLLTASLSQAQDNNVKGFVYEKSTGEPMMFCNVYFK